MAQNRAKTATPATRATTLPPAAMTLAAPLKVTACVGAGVADVVIALVPVAAEVVELPTGKGAEEAVVEVAGGATGTGVVEVVEVLLDVEEVLLDVEEELDVEELEVEATTGVLAIAEEEEPEQG